MIPNITKPTNAEVRESLKRLRSKYNASWDEIAPLFEVKSKRPIETMSKWYKGGDDQVSSIPLSRWHSISFYLNQ